MFRLLLNAEVVYLVSMKERDVAHQTPSYIFAAQVMPKWTFKKLHGIIMAVIQTLLRDVFFYISGLDRKRLRYILKQWQEPPHPCISTRGQRRHTRDQCLQDGRQGISGMRSPYIGRLVAAVSEILNKVLP